jgi:glycogen phosphorylase
MAMIYGWSSDMRPMAGDRGPPMATTGSNGAGQQAAPDEIATIKAAILAKLNYAVGKNEKGASPRDWLIATALAVRDRITERWIASVDSVYASGGKRVYYLSLEFMIGRLLIDNLSNTGMLEPVRGALSELGIDLDAMRSLEPDAALGNGGLGRLAACFMESMASLAIPAHGYGIRYDHGMFRQVIKDGWQQEYPENWLAFGNPWEFERPEMAYAIGFGGSVMAETDENGEPRQIWIPGEIVEAVAFDTPVCGWRARHVNTLRLWSARAVDAIRLDAFNRGDHIGALADRVRVESISKVLYPSDSTPAGQELRLRQEFFFVSASLQDLVRRHLRQFGDIALLPEKAAIQLNDTHPALAVTELMRILVDLHQIPWIKAWEITRGTINYTNHTLLPEALESWPVPLLERLLPRHMQIIYLINAFHLDALREAGKDEDFVASVSLIDEHGGRRARMGSLAFLGAGKVNGVSALHSDLMKVTVFRDLHDLYPDRITNKTNGITFRRWLFQANPDLTGIITDAVGEQALDQPARLADLVKQAGSTALQDRMMAARQKHKQRLAALIRERLRIAVDPNAMFDVQIKRIHEYKRQLLNIIETVALYDSIRAQPTRNWAPRVKIFAGKAAASYHQAKMIIKLANDVARVINSDPTLRGLLKVVFLPNYNVSLAEAIIPAADLSEQISTAGMEASGTGNMKFGLNGALTIGTLDGANVEMKERVGDDNIFIFGMTTEEVAQRRRTGINARDIVSRSIVLDQAIESIRNGVFSPDDPSRYAGFIDSIVDNDYFMVLADFDAYYATQRSIDALWRDRRAWWKKSILNTANMGWFSSDRTIVEYADEIWKVPVQAER